MVVVDLHLSAAACLDGMADSKLLPPVPAANEPAAKRSRGSKSGGSHNGKDAQHGPKDDDPLDKKVKQYVIYPTRCSTDIPHKPDGRLCPACWLTDDMLDPVAEALAKKNDEPP